jgi:hypothetical protein
MLPAVILAAAAAPPAPAWAQAKTDRQQEVEMAFDQYTAAKTEDERVAVIDYLQHFDRKLVAGALVDHIIASDNGNEATAYNRLVAALSPDGCDAVLDRIATVSGPIAKGKLIVALRHCEGDKTIHALAGCLDDKRVVHFEAHGATPRRVCDLAYDELFLKLRGDRAYHLDPSPHMIGIITEKTPEKDRDALIAKLKAKLAKLPLPTPTPAPPAAPQTTGTGATPI